MIGNIYLLEKALERDAAERQVLVERAALLRVPPAAPLAEQPSPPAGARILLRIGPLVLAWAVAS